MSIVTMIGGYTLTWTSRSVYMTFVCPGCLIFKLLKFPGTFSDTRGNKFGSDELMFVLCRL
jgi:hypothetical protein